MNSQAKDDYVPNAFEARRLAEVAAEKRLNQILVNVSPPYLQERLYEEENCYIFHVRDDVFHQVENKLGYDVAYVVIKRKCERDGQVVYMADWRGHPELNKHHALMSKMAADARFFR
jgi:hypothetical protein